MPRLYTQKRLSELISQSVLVVYKNPYSATGQLIEITRIPIAGSQYCRWSPQSLGNVCTYCHVRDICSIPLSGAIPLLGTDSRTIAAHRRTVIGRIEHQLLLVCATEQNGLSYKDITTYNRFAGLDLDPPITSWSIDIRSFGAIEVRSTVRLQWLPSLVLRLKRRGRSGGAGSPVYQSRVAI